MSSFSPSPYTGAPSHQNRSSKRWLWWVLGVVGLIASVLLAPLAALAGLVLLIVGLVRWSRSGKPAAPGRSAPKRKTAVTMTAAGVAMMLVGGGITGVAGSMNPQPQNDTPVAKESSTSATGGQSAPASSVPTESTASPTQESLEDRLGQSCTNDREVVSLAGAKVYCDPDPSGALVWVSAAEHDAAERAAAQLADQKKLDADKAVKEQAAEDKAAKEAAAAKAKQEKAQQAAAKKAAEEKAAKAKAAAEQKAKASKSAQPKVNGLVGNSSSGGSVHYKNCDAVRAAGKAPLFKGQPGYSLKLDRDKDGQACGRDN